MLQCRTDIGFDVKSYRPKCLSYECAARHLPAYDAFIRQFINDGFNFHDFNNYWGRDRFTKDNKLVIIRHDVHRRNITDTYYASVIERHLIGPDATYYVMLDYPPEEAMPDYPKFKQGYLELIAYLDSLHTDIQPHISITDMYVSQCKPWWRDLKEAELMAIFDTNYKIEKGHECTILEIIGTEQMQLERMNDSIPVLLHRYNEKGKGECGLTVRDYAALGSPLPFNHVFNNQDVMNQCNLIGTGVYLFDTNNSRIAHDLHYLSDNNLPVWMDHPAFIEPGRCQLLMHPRLWENPDSTRIVSAH